MDVWHFSCPSLPKVKGLVVIGIFVQVYQRLKFWLSLALFFQVCQRWKFWFLLAFCPSLPTVKVLFSLPRFLLLVTLAMNTNSENSVIWSVPLSNLWHPAQPQILWFGVCLWATYGIPLRHTRVRVRRRQSLAHCCENSSYSSWQLLTWD